MTWACLQLLTVLQSPLAQHLLQLTGLGYVRVRVLLQHIDGVRLRSVLIS